MRDASERKTLLGHGRSDCRATADALERRLNTSFRHSPNVFRPHPAPRRHVPKRGSGSLDDGALPHRLPAPALHLPACRPDGRARAEAAAHRLIAGITFVVDGLAIASRRLKSSRITPLIPRLRRIIGPPVYGRQRPRPAPAVTSACGIGRTRAGPAPRISPLCGSGADIAADSPPAPRPLQLRFPVLPGDEYGMAVASPAALRHAARHHVI